jgi:hypothetical protein
MLDRSAARVTVVSVSTGHRVVLPKDLAQCVVWLNDAQESLTCIIEWLGDVPGLQIRPSDLVGHEYVPEAWLAERQALRILASRWPIRLERHGETFRFTIPEPVRRAGLLPGDNDDKKEGVLLFASHDVFEVWRPSEWRRNLRRICWGRGAVTRPDSPERATSP